MTFREWMETSGSNINWNNTIRSNWIDSSTGKTHHFKIEQRSLDSLRPQEKPSRYRVKKMIASMLSGAFVPLISVSEYGLIWDGHARYYAAINILGTAAIVPVEIDSLVNE